MFKFCSLFSGSSGNCLLIQSSETKILIDAGESAKKIIEALSSLNIDITEISAIFVTHEHSDHVKGLGTLSKKYDIPVYATEETWSAMPEQMKKINLMNIKKFMIGDTIEIRDLKISPFSIPHDAVNPCGFNVYNNSNKISIATDIGEITKDVFDSLKHSKFILLESNYDPNILKCSSYPYSLKQRILGPTGHLSNQLAGKLISNLTHYGLTQAMLGHLSKENNFPELAYKTVVEELINDNVDLSTIKLSVATRSCISPIIEL